MRADIHDGPEHTLQSEAGYIDARPYLPDRRKPLATHGRTIHWGQEPGHGHFDMPTRATPAESLNPDRFAGRQDYEVAYEARKTGRSKSAVKARRVEALGRKKRSALALPDPV
jgi:hypothetical protein